MADLLDQAVARVRTLTAERQQEAAELLMQIADQETSALRLSPEQRAEVRRRLAEPADHATDAELAAS
jgi:hypothetical protein